MWKKMISFFYRFSFWIILFLFLFLFLIYSSEPQKEGMAAFLLVFCSIAYFCIKKLMKGYQFELKKEKAERNHFFETVYLCFFTSQLSTYYLNSIETPPSFFCELLVVTFFFFVLLVIEILFMKLKKKFWECRKKNFSSKK